MVSTSRYRGFLFPKLGKLLNEKGNMTAGNKVELESMEKQLKLLQEKHTIIGNVGLVWIKAAESAWLSHTKKLFCDAEVIVDSLLVPPECPDPAANPDGSSTLLENTNSTEIADTKIKKITERGLMLMQLLFMEGRHLRALYKQEEETELVGIDGPRDALIKMLAVGEDLSENQLKKVCITGIPGSGKTTLARVVYNQLKPQFDCGAFVRPPAFVDSKGEWAPPKNAFLWEMLSQLDTEDHMNIKKNAFGSGDPVDEIRQVLQNKRYLVVIDNTCDREQFGWILQVLANNVCGSRIISTVSTVSISWVGLSLLDESVYEIKGLGYPDSRKLFQQKFFVCEASCSSAPTDVLDEILKMCGGIPSAIISTALLLATRVTATKPWDEMLNSIYSTWKQLATFVDFESANSIDFSELRQILLIPYSHLPGTLKECLLCLAVEAKTRMIQKTTMVRKWMAEEIIYNYGGLSREKVASWYFDELIDKNFIQLVEYGNYLGEEIYEVNYMMHNVLRWLAQEEKIATIFSDGGTSREYAESLRLSIQCSGSELSVYTSKMKSDIYSITTFGPVKFYVYCYLECLLVLDLDGCKDMDNSAMVHICKMTRLRYLSLKHTQVTEIPPEIGALHDDLRTLDICQTEISNLPPEIGKLENLKTLDASRTQISSLPREIAELQNLETLDISQSKISNLPPEIGELKKLKTLDASRTQISSVPREIAELQNLETLDICQTEISNLPPEIGKLENLKTLDASRTQISSLPREIAELQNLETLDISQSKISNLPPEIGELKKLKTLDASRTQISSVPREIAELQNLETLDVRQTQVKELPKELLELPKLAHLYYGQSDFPREVKLPMGSHQSNSVKVVGTVDSREWLGSAMEEVSGLTGVRELEVVLHDQPADKDQNEKLLSFIARWENLESLIIYGDYNPSDDFVPVSPYFPILKMLKAAGRFVKVPRWIAHLSTLKKLDVRVCKLDQDDLKILGGLKVLSTLALALISILRKKRVNITSRLHSSTCTDLHPLEETCLGGFAKLEVFNFDCHVPWITFEQGAMPRLKHLHLKLFPCPANKFPSGIVNLCSLQNIILRYSSHHANSSGVTNAVAAMREEASSHANPIVISVVGYHDDEVFLLNTRVDETINGTATKEASNHGNRIELSVNGDQEVLETRVDGTMAGTDIKEVLLSKTRVDETIAGTEIE